MAVFEKTQKRSCHPHRHQRIACRLTVWASGWTDVSLARVFLELSSERERWRQALEGLDVIKSPFMESLREEGRIEAQAKAIVQFLTLRFPGQLPADLRATIENTRDRARLDQWLTLAATAPTLDAFRHDGSF